MSRRLALIALLATVGVLWTASLAAARDVSVEEAAQLIDSARTDPASRGQLAEITSVEGRPVDFGPLLSGTEDDVDRRLETVASASAATPAPDAATARSQAASILSAAEFRTGAATEPGVFEAILDWLGRLIPDSIGDALADPTLWTLLAAATIGVGLFYALRAIRRRRRSEALATTGHAPALGPSPAQLERDARTAASAGNYSLAVRLWFRAGAMRLAEHGVVAVEATTTSGSIRRAVPGPTMAALARTFDEVAYGRRRADAADAAAAEAGWSQVATEAARRG